MGSDEKPRERRNAIGPTARTVGANVRRLRQEMGDTQADLAARLKGNGHPIPVASIGRIESGDRRVEVDDLVALSVALGASPLALLLPYTRSPRDEVALTGWSTAAAVEVWRWALAGVPLTEVDDEDSLYLTIRRSFPWWLDPHAPSEGDAAPAGLWELIQGRDGVPDGAVIMELPAAIVARHLKQGGEERAKS